VKLLIRFLEGKKWKEKELSAGEGAEGSGGKETG